MDNSVTGGFGSRIRVVSIGLAGVAVNAGAPATACAGPATFQGLGDLPGGTFYSQANAVSADGSTVVGHSQAGGLDHEGFRWTRPGGMQPLGGVTEIPASRANAVNADGSVIVGLSGTTFSMEAFRWTAAGGMTALPRLAPGNITNLAWGVSGDGSVVVGQSNSGNGRAAFRWTAPTGVQPLPDPSAGTAETVARAVSADGSVVVGQRNFTNGGYEAAFWDAGGTVRGLGGIGPENLGSVGAAVSADGRTIVGTASVPIGNDDSTSIAFRWTEAGGMVALGDLPGGGVYSLGHAVSGDGSVVVGISRSTAGEEAFLWTPSGFRGLKDVLVSDHGLDLTGWTLKDATGISADGRTIVGWGTNPAGGTEAWVAVVPEPSLLGGITGVAGLSLLPRRRRQAQS